MLVFFFELFYGNNNWPHLFIMRSIVKYYFLLLLIIATYYSSAQQLMKTVYDVQKLKTNEDCFIGNPLKNLLNEIGPEIKMVFVDTFDQRVGHSLLIFKFVNRQEQGNYNLAGKR